MKTKFFLIVVLITFFPYKLLSQYEIMFSNDYPPYNFTDKKGELTGFNVEILKAISDLYGIDISIYGNDWKTINTALDSGYIAAIGGAHYSGIPSDDYIFTYATVNTSHCFFYHRKRIKNFSLEYFRTLKEPLVALWENDVLIHYIQSINPTARFVFADSYENLVEQIENEDVVCLFGQRVGVRYHAVKAGKDYLLPLDHRILERNMGFKVSSAYPELARIINNGLEVMYANGQYENLYNTWIKDYNENPFSGYQYLRYAIIAGVTIAFLILFLMNANWFLQRKIRAKTADLQQQLELNLEIMDELEKQKLRAEESDRMKTAFLANVSHEIRTPMNGILGFAELLQTVNYSAEKQAQILRIIQQSGNRMLRTINNIIDVSKLEAGMEKVHIKKINFQELISELFVFFGSEARLKNIELIREESDFSTSKPFYSDEYKINSILTNLMKNAIKFTKKGEVKISYSFQGDDLIIRVSDTGIGIQADKQKSIYEQFVQADFSHSNGNEGSGLGLSIVKGYVELLNGEISLISEEGKGTEFTIRIPNHFQEEANIREGEGDYVRRRTPDRRYKILIAEDDEVSYTYLKHALSEVAEIIRWAKNGKEAIEMVKEFQDTDIVFMDIKMPGINGFEATKEIRQFNSKVCIIAQSAFTQDSIKERVFSVGGDAYISKPIKRQKLLDIIADLNIN